MVDIYSQGQKMSADFCIPREGAPCILMSHGLESSKDGNKWLVLAPRLHDAGFASLRFSYRGCGEGTDKSEGEFEDTTLTGRIADYRAAIDFLQKENIDTTRLGVIGSSFGGMIALAAGAERVKAMVTMATPTHIPTQDGERLAGTAETDYIELASGRRLKAGFYIDTLRYNIEDEIRKIHCPLLVMHGALDEVVPVADAHTIYSRASEPKQLEIMDGANHSFHDPVHLDRVIGLSLEWFKTYL